MASMVMTPATPKLSLVSLPEDIVDALLSSLVDRNRHDYDPRTVLYDVHKEDLQALSLLSSTCKAVEEVCAPHFFRRVVLSTPREAIGFLRCITRKAYVRGQVKILSIRYQSPESVRFGPMAEADIVGSDLTAQKVQQNKTVPMVAIAHIRIMQHLSALQKLSVPAATFLQVQHWPKAERLEGASIITLALTREADGQGSIRHCGLLQWLKSFRPGQEPAVLDRLALDHICVPGLSDHHLDGVSDKWAALLAKATYLHLQRFPYENLRDILGPCQNLKSLRVSHTTLSIKQIIDAVTASPHLHSLEYLDIAVETVVQARHVGVNTLFNPFVAFKNLRNLKLPIPVAREEEMVPAVTLPPRMEGLELAWTTPREEHLWNLTFLDFLKDAVKWADAEIHHARVDSGLQGGDGFLR